MATKVNVPVVELKNLREHSNADKLAICDVLGYQMVIPKGMYKENDKLVYFPADVLIPYEWAEKFNVLSFLRGKDKDRVGKIKLRGEPSFGLVVSLPDDVDWQVGDNVADYYRAKKYEPPLRPNAGDSAKYDSKIEPHFQRYTDIENGRIYVDVIKEGEEVVVTEKIHGTNSRLGFINGIAVAGSMGLRRKRPQKVIEGVVVNLTDEPDPEAPILKVDCGFDDPQLKANTYWFPWSVKHVSMMLNDILLHNNCKQLLIYGEVYGSSIQKGFGYNAVGKFGYRVFDMLMDGKYLNWEDLKKVCSDYGVETVPVLYEGAFSMDKIKELADGKTTMIENGHIREGVVVKPVVERIDPQIGRVALKYIGTEYALKKNKSDFTDV